MQITTSLLKMLYDAKVLKIFFAPQERTLVFDLQSRLDYTMDRHHQYGI